LFFLVFRSSRDRQWICQYEIGFDTAEELRQMPLFAQCPVFVKKLEHTGRKIMFKEKVSQEEQDKVQKMLDEIDAAASAREGISVEEFRAQIRKGAEKIVKQIKAQKRKSRITKAFHLRYEWERNRMYFIFQKIPTDGNGKMLFA
jgi:hypothetical protein